MIVYHGSTEIIKNPDVVHSKKYLDFGRGFYITTFENQAKKWAVRKGMRQEKTVDMYFRGLWDKEKVLGELRYYKMNNQICIVNQETLNRLITFKRAYEVDDHGR